MCRLREEVSSFFLSLLYLFISSEVYFILRAPRGGGRVFAKEKDDEAVEASVISISSRWVKGAYSYFWPIMNSDGRKLYPPARSTRPVVRIFH